MNDSIFKETGTMSHLFSSCAFIVKVFFSFKTVKHFTHMAALYIIRTGVMTSLPQINFKF